MACYVRARTVQLPPGTTSFCALRYLPRWWKKHQRDRLGGQGCKHCALWWLLLAPLPCVPYQAKTPRSCRRTSLLVCKPSSCSLGQILCSFFPPLKRSLAFEAAVLSPRNREPVNTGASHRKCWWKTSVNCVLLLRKWDFWSQINSSSSCTSLTSSCWILLLGSFSSTSGHP